MEDLSLQNTERQQYFDKNNPNKSGLYSLRTYRDVFDEIQPNST